MNSETIAKNRAIYENAQVKKFMRAKKLAEHLGIGLSTVWLYAKQGKIKPIKVSDRVTVFNVADVELALLGADSEAV